LLDKLAAKIKRICHVAMRDPKLLLYGPTPPIYGMTTKWEQAYLVEFSQNQYTGEGEIVDLGCWMGAMSICAARGLANNKRVKDKSKRIHAYDLFVWSSSRDEHFGVIWQTEKPEDGGSFLNEFLARTQSWETFIQPHVGDLSEIGWDQSKKIEVLHNDASKSWSAMNGIISNFYPALIPGISIVIEQDFAHYYTSWLHLIRYALREYFQPIYTIPLSSSIVFRYVKPVPEELLKKVYSFESFSMNEMEKAFDYSLSIADKELHPGILGAKAMLFIWLDDRERARQEIVTAARNGLLRGEIGLVRQFHFPEMENWDWVHDKAL
jgi:hypothetical protein